MLWYIVFYLNNWKIISKVVVLALDYLIFKFQRNALFKYFSLFFEVCVGTTYRQWYLSDVLWRIKNIGCFQIGSV